MNRLARSTSPYLQQHAANPVDWQPWDAAALAQAKAEDKPIFISIGYATCHWCHVMAHESFENERVAAELNRCCRDQSLSVPAIVRQLDRLNRVVLFEILYDELVVAEQVPAFGDIFASLGIDVVDGEVTLQTEGPGARLRSQIARGNGL